MDLNDISDECGRDSRAWFPDTADNTFFMAACAAGEAGEALNFLKKIERGTHAPDEVMGDVLNECMDAFIYLMCVFDIEGQDVVALYKKVREANARRFGAPEVATGG
jgi:hypothetical protein